MEVMIIDDDFNIVDDSNCQPCHVRYSTATVQRVACKPELLQSSLVLSHVARWFTLLLAMVAVIIVLFNASCTVVSLFFAYFCFLGSLWHLRLIRLHQVRLNSSLSRFQSSELPSFRIFCPKCGSLVGMDYGEWATYILKLFKLIWLRGEAHHLAGPWILWQTSWRLKTNSFR